MLIGVRTKHRHTGSREVGDIVRYRSEFLCNIGVHTGDLCFCSGSVQKLEVVTGSLVLAYIEGDRPDIPGKVNVKNLEKKRVG